MHQLVLRCVCITLILHGIGLAATKFFARAPTPEQMALYYYSSAFALVAYAVAVTLIVRVSSQQPAADHSVRCSEVANGAFLVAACAGPPLFLAFLVSPAPAVRIALACLAAACALSLFACCCWSGWAAAGDQQSQFLSSSAGPPSDTEVGVSQCGVLRLLMRLAP